MPNITFHVPYSDMRWKNPKDESPSEEGIGTAVLGLFLYWDSTNHCMQEVVKHCMFDDEGNWSVIEGWEDGPDGSMCIEEKCGPPAFWAEMRFFGKGHPTLTGIGNAELN